MDSLETLLKSLPEKLQLNLASSEKEELRAAMSSLIADDLSAEAMLLKDFSAVSLNALEKNALRSELVHFMSNRETFIEGGESPIRKAQHWLTVGLPLLWQGFLPRMAVMGCLFVLVGSGVAYASEETLPGDFFYPVKVHVVEPMQRSLIASKEDKVQWETHLALRRLKEADVLQERGKLEEKTLRTLEIASFRYMDSASSLSQHLEGSSESSTIQKHVEEIRQKHGNHLLQLKMALGQKNVGKAQEAIDRIRESLPLPPAILPAGVHLPESADDIVENESEAQSSELNQSSSSSARSKETGRARDMSDYTEEVVPASEKSVKGMEKKLENMHKKVEKFESNQDASIEELIQDVSDDIEQLLP